MRGKWGKIPVRDFYFLSRGFIFNSAGLKRSENELSIKNDFSNPSWRPSGLLRKGEGQRNRESWGKSGPKSPCGISIAKMHHKVLISLFPGRPVRLLKIKGNFQGIFQKEVVRARAEHEEKLDLVSN